MTRTGLVLGGGGVTGIAWEVGLLAGLRDGGADVSGADLVIGTSAGSAVGAVVASGEDLEDLYGEQSSPPAEGEVGAAFGTREAVTLLDADAAAGKRPDQATADRAGRAEGPPRSRRRPGRGVRRATAARGRLAAGLARARPQDHRRRRRQRLVHRVRPGRRRGSRARHRGQLRGAAGVAARGDRRPPLRRRRHALRRERRPGDRLRRGARRSFLCGAHSGSTTRCRNSCAVPARGGPPGSLPTRPRSRPSATNVLDPAMRMGAARAGREQGRRMAAEVGEGWVSGR